MLRATVSGSFHRHMAAIYGAVHELFACGVNVLSPADPRVVDFKGEFLFVASDKLRSVKLVQDRHLQAIRSSDFLWVSCPDGYTGPSTCMEIGHAYAVGVPIFSDHAPLDITIQHYVRVVSSLKAAVDLAGARSRSINKDPHILLDPNGVIEENIDALEQLLPALNGTALTADGEAERLFESTRRRLRGSFGFR